jgi:hypothetical protein
MSRNKPKERSARKNGEISHEVAALLEPRFQELSDKLDILADLCYTVIKSEGKDND